MKFAINNLFILLLSCFTLPSLQAAELAEPFQCKVPRNQEPEVAVIDPDDYPMDYEFEIPADREVAARYRRLKAKFCKKMKLCRTHPIVAAEVRKALRANNITEPIIVLQDENCTNSYCLCLNDELYYPVKAMVVGIADNRGEASIEFIRHGIFHEAAHIAHGDIKPKEFENFAYVAATLGLGTLAGIKTSNLARSQIGKPASMALGIGVGIMTPFIVGRTYRKTVGSYFRRDMERKADIAAAQKLLECDEVPTLIDSFLDYSHPLDKGEYNMRNEFWFFCDHPEYKERAQIILDALEKAGIDSTKFPADLEDDWKQRFAAQLKKYFPERVAFFKV